MSKIPANNGNAISAQEGLAAGFQGIGGAGDSDLTVLSPATRDGNGNPLTAAAGGPGTFTGTGKTGDDFDSAGRNASRNSNGQNTNPAYR